MVPDEVDVCLPIDPLHELWGVSPAVRTLEVGILGDGPPGIRFTIEPGTLLPLVRATWWFAFRQVHHRNRDKRD